MYKHILIPTDGSALSESALKQGIDFAKSIDARVTLLTVSVPYHLLSTDALSLSDTGQTYKDDAERRGAARLKVGSAYAREKGVAVTAEHVFADHPYEAILAAAARAGCDVICMASHGRRGMSGLLLGSETLKVLTHSKLPVMVYR
jgi:nucleotide-binding universal stress UspA family protein